MLATVPLSYTPIDAALLNEVLVRYADQPHTKLVTDFEGAIRTYVNSPHAVAVASGTAAIHLALLALGVGQGDVVIAPTFTYVATVNPILYVGATPVLIDAAPDTWNMDPELLYIALTNLQVKGILPKAILLVHTYGVPAKMNELLAVADRFGVPIIEDAAESLGARYAGRATGTLGRIGIYSFNNNKTLTTYGGGMVVTADASLAVRVRFLAAQAREPLPYYRHREVGYNYLMSPLSAAYGLSQFPRLEALLAHRRWVCAGYQKRLPNLTWLAAQPHVVESHWLSTPLFETAEQKKNVAQALAVAGIETRPLWHPMHCQPVFAGYPVYGGKCSEDLFARGLCLPGSHDLQSDVLDRIGEILSLSSNE